MSTARRRLGTGPSTTRITPTPDGLAPRLLPAERIHEARLLDDAADGAVADGKGRRTLGPGTSPAPEGCAGK
ncbi:hypothetical protein [Streptomyces sp. NPDC060187]|uniref:hypothetical protein n=1 Tax=Streptomyces sp. NPDC060187 TaxID=3347067 RepID=UPI00365A5E81